MKVGQTPIGSIAAGVAPPAGAGRAAGAVRAAGLVCATGAAIVVVACAACRPAPGPAADPEVVARCEAALACGCTTFSSQAQCEGAVAAAIDSVRAVAEGAGLARDETCVARMVAAYGAVGCAAAGSAAVKDGFLCDLSFCPIFHGTAASGEPCKVAGSYLAAISDCLPDLGCFGGVCVPAGCGIAAGAACTAGGVPTGRCVAGYFCEAGGSGTCVARAALGAPCVTDGCVEGAYCDTTGGGVCVALLTGGAPCMQARQCDSGTCGAAGTCEPASTTPYVCGA